MSVEFLHKTLSFIFSIYFSFFFFTYLYLYRIVFFMKMKTRIIMNLPTIEEQMIIIIHCSHPFYKLPSEMSMDYALTLWNYSSVCIAELKHRRISPVCFSLFFMLAYITIYKKRFLDWNKPNSLTTVLTFMLDKVQAWELLRSKLKGRHQPLTQKETFQFRLNQLKMQDKIGL